MTDWKQVAALAARLHHALTHVQNAELPPVLDSCVHDDREIVLTFLEELQYIAELNFDDFSC